MYYVINFILSGHMQTHIHIFTHCISLAIMCCSIFHLFHTFHNSYQCRLHIKLGPSLRTFSRNESSASTAKCIRWSVKREREREKERE